MHKNIRRAATPKKINDEVENLGMQDRRGLKKLTSGSCSS